MTFTKLHLALLASAVIAVPTIATAQPNSDERPARVGFEGGFGIYGGEINCSNSDGNELCDGITEAAGLDLHLNYFFSESIGIYADVWPMVHTEDNWTFTHNVVTVGVKVRPAPILTLAAGVGSAQARVSYEVGPFEGEKKSEVAPAVFVSAAVEVLRGRSFALDLQARGGLGFYGSDENDTSPDITGRNLGLGAALTWF